ncbi:DUF3566 domain-containing protein [Acrocarpospora catenulata]|uniref:DUF3566 domain-containing protein n=1 Tax=Acrocarpospora catenulata TaxID=2836182 RepID=UPI0020239749|nr:DUF3566 domain-containing protein [Acrocarpospora catenulata]
MSNPGSASARTSKTSKGVSARPASSSMRDGVSERIGDGDGSEPKAEPQETKPTGPASPTSPAEDTKPGDSTVRIRTASAGDKPWSARRSEPDDAPTTYGTPRPPGGASRPPTTTPAVPATSSALNSALGSPADTTERPVLRTQPGEDRKPTAVRAPRKAHLVLRRVEPWSAMKFSFVVSLVCFVVLFVAVAVLYGVLSAMGVFDEIVKAVNQLTVGENATPSFDVASWFEPVRILGYTALLGAVNVVLITALATLGAVIYNLSADLVGGIEVTFSEAE